MRIPMLALLGLMIATTPALAGKRTGAPEGRQVAAKMAAAPAAKSQARIHFTLHRGAPARAARGAVLSRAVASCGSRHCRAAAPVRASFGWAQGLPPAAWVQANECPDGTMATLARGHEDVVRCMPI